MDEAPGYCISRRLLFVKSFGDSESRGYSTTLGAGKLDDKPTSHLRWQAIEYSLFRLQFGGHWGHVLCFNDF